MTDFRMLDARLAAMGRYERVTSAQLERFRSALLAADDWALHRVNPVQFAEASGLPADETVDLFILGSREGLFDLGFLELCPHCGGVAQEVAHIGALAPVHYACQACQVEVDAALDANVAVAFTVSATVRPLALNPWTDLWTYMRYHTFSAYVPSPTVRAYLSTRPSAFAAVDAQGQGVLEVDTTGETELFVGSVEGGRFMTVPVRPGGPLTASLALGPGSLGLDVLELGPGKVRLTVQNPLPVRAGVLAMARSPEAFMAALAGGRARFLPYVTARDILSNPRFREVYRVQELPADLQLRIKSLTLLFTDLSGSTALYDSTGDVTAFDIVREHFALLTDCVRRHQGAVVKTMGDAVMASFVHPRDAVAAAREMLEVMAPVTARAAKFGHPVGLKVGIHEGSALVVNAESRLDYFGQTVNVAARVQGLAGPGEVWVTRPVFSAAGEGLTGAGFTADVRQVPLKGVEGLVDVVACARA